MGNYVTYLTRAPYVRFSGAMGDYLDDCDIDPALIDPLGIGNSGVRRRKRSAEAGDYIFDANFTEIPSYEEDVLVIEGPLILLCGNYRTCF